MRATRLLPAAALVVSLCAEAWAYSDPGGLFSLPLPEGWDGSQEDLGEGRLLTKLAAADSLFELEVLTLPAAEPLPDDQLDAQAAQAIEFAISVLQRKAAVRGQPAVPVTFAGKDAVRWDALLLDEFNQPASRFRMYVVLGTQHVVCAAVTATVDDLVSLREGDRLLSGFSVGGGPQVAAPEPAVVRATGLALVAERVKSDFRTAPETVLAEGEPPLTEGTVQACSQVLEAVYGARLTEQELGLVGDQWALFYDYSDAEGRQVVVELAATPLDRLAEGSADERIAARQELRAALDERIATGVEAGAEWATALWEVLGRRAEVIASATELPPEELPAGLDESMSRADLEASLELLAFIWLAAGRDVAAVTAEAMQPLRGYLAAEYASLPLELQYLLANAEPVYGDMRVAWALSEAEAHTALAQDFSQALDACGLDGEDDQAGGEGAGSVWDDPLQADPAALNAGPLVTTCFGLAQKAAD